jgi:hypothetical protein
MRVIATITIQEKLAAWLLGRGAGAWLVGGAAQEEQVYLHYCSLIIISYCTVDFAFVFTASDK